MIDYFCGRPHCGKSLVAEQFLSTISGPILYVGTLPDILPYRNIIKAHQQRRPICWDLYECCGDPMTDLSYLSEALERYRGILLDGTIFYLNRTIQWGYEPDASALKLIKSILKRAANLPIWLIIVDQPLYDMPRTIQLFGRIFHQMIYLYSKHLYLVVDGEATLCQPHTLRDLDRRIYSQIDNLENGHEGK